jgi:signal transduction histidine kinase
VRAARRDLDDAASGVLPSLVASRGLSASIATLAASTNLDVSVCLHCPADVPDATAAAVWFVVAESVANATKHAEATELRIAGTVGGNNSLEISVTDNGRGGANVSGSGLTGLRDRVMREGGRLRVSSPDGCGTVITAVFPIGAPA